MGSGLIACHVVGDNLQDKKYYLNATVSGCRVFLVRYPAVSSHSIINLYVYCFALSHFLIY